MVGNLTVWGRMCLYITNAVADISDGLFHAISRPIGRISVTGKRRSGPSAVCCSRHSRLAPGRAGVPVLATRQYRGPNVADAWPISTFLELGAFPGAVPCARLHAKQVLWEWRMIRLRESAELLVSELVTNAIQVTRSYAHTCPVRLWLLSDRARVLILVWDASPLPPVQMNASEDAESGRGLLLVETLSARWGWYFLPQEKGGKVVWALLEM